MVTNSFITINNFVTQLMSQSNMIKLKHKTCNSVTSKFFYTWCNNFVKTFVFKKTKKNTL